MSGKKTIRKKLQGSNSFNPFNREFDVDKLKRYIEQAELKSDDDKYAKTIAESAEIYNYYYNEYVEAIKKAIEKENISIVDVVETVFGMANSDYIQLSKQAMKNRQNKSLFDFAHLELDNSEQSFGTINIVGAVEGQVDYINTILNIIRHIVIIRTLFVSFAIKYAIENMNAPFNINKYLLSKITLCNMAQITSTRRIIPI